MKQTWSLDDYLIYVGGINGTKSDNSEKTGFGRVCNEISMDRGTAGGNLGTSGSDVFLKQVGSREHCEEGSVKPCRNAGRNMQSCGTN